MSVGLGGTATLPARFPVMSLRSAPRSRHQYVQGLNTPALQGLARVARDWRRTALAALLLVASALPAVAQPFPNPDESKLDRHGHYTNRTGQEVHQPARSLNGAVPAGATARCRDGDYSFSRHHSGTCSGHGGVAAWLH